MRSNHGVLAAVVTLIGLAALSDAAAQTASEVQGTWKLSSAVVSGGGTTRDIFGPHPSGVMVFDRGGRFVQVIVASGLPKFASKSRETGTAEENRSIVQGSIAYFGTYSVAEGGTVNLKVEASTYPNMTGTEPQRSIKLSGDALTWRNAAPAVGAGVAEQIWKRAD